jgi:hypothetical protein
MLQLYSPVTIQKRNPSSLSPYDHQSLCLLSFFADFCKILKTLAKAACVNEKNREEVERDIAMIGKRHRSYGVRTKWLPDFRDALIWTLKQPEFFGLKWDDQLEDAWFKGFNYAASIMRRELRTTRHSEPSATASPTPTQLKLPRKTSCTIL